MLVERGAGVVLGQHALEARVVALDGDHGVVHDLADGGLRGAILQVAPACHRRYPEYILGFVFILIFRVGPRVVAFARHELGAVFLEAVGDVFQEDEAEDDVLVFCRVHIVAQLVGGEPEFGLEADGGGGNCLSAHMIFLHHIQKPIGVRRNYTWLSMIILPIASARGLKSRAEAHKDRLRGLNA